MAQQGRNRRRRPEPASEDKGAAGRAGGAAASRAAERLKEREADRIRRRNITIGLAVGGALLVLIVLFILVNIPQEAPVPDGAVERYAELTLSRTTDGYPVLGEPNAKVKVNIYSSFDCPNCRTFHDEIMPALIERAGQGAIAITYVPLYGYGSVPNGQGAAIAALCAGEQDAFWPFHDMLFNWQGVYGNQSFANNRIASGVAALSLDGGAHGACVSSGVAQTTLAAARTDVQGLLNFTGTPTVAINGIVPVDAEQVPLAGAAAILAAIDAEVERIAAASVGTTPEATPEAAPEATDEATPAEESPAEATDEATPAEAPTAEATAEATPAS